MEILTLVLFALALNLDAFGAGTAYGLRNIKLPFTSVLIISGMSMAAITVSMLAGHTLSGYIPETVAHRVGGILLMAVGLWVLVQSLQSHRNGTVSEHESRYGTVMEIHIRSLGLIIQVLREPSRADLDKSGEISAREALLLGLALSMDALAAGFAVSMLGFSVLTTAVIVGAGHLILTYAGLILGKGAAATAIGRQLSAIPGCILITLGILKIYP
jgi:putative sporulation protein YtaF